MTHPLSRLAGIPLMLLTPILAAALGLACAEGSGTPAVEATFEVSFETHGVQTFSVESEQLDDGSSFFAPGELIMQDPLARVPEGTDSIQITVTSRTAPDQPVTEAFAYFGQADLRMRANLLHEEGSPIEVRVTGFRENEALWTATRVVLNAQVSSDGDLQLVVLGEITVTNTATGERLHSHHRIETIPGGQGDDQLPHAWSAYN